MTPQVFTILSGLIEEKVGLHYDASQLELLSERVQSRATEAGFDSLLDYYYYLRYDGASDKELSLLVDRLVVRETYFFRERRQLEVAVGEFVESAVSRGERPRVWSAACSTGEEILSVAMLLAHRGILDRAELFASDISASALAKAKTGRYSKRSVRDAWPPEAEPFLRWDQQEVVVAPHIVDAVEFLPLNLLDPAAIAGLPAFDVIFCRNVLIYFRDATVSRIVSALSQKLRPDGALFVGISESLLRFETTLVCEEHGGVFLYRNPQS